MLSVYTIEANDLFLTQVGTSIVERRSSSMMIHACFGSGFALHQRDEMFSQQPS